MRKNKPTIPAVILSAIFLLAGYLPMLATTRAWHHLTIDDGLLSDHVYSTVMDKEGMVWFATRYGLTSYNGSKAITYPPLSAHTTPKIYNDILSVCTAEDGRIYFVTPLLFCVYDKYSNRFEPISIDSSKNFKSVIHLSSGELLIMSNNVSNDRIVFYNPTTGKYYDIPNSDNLDLKGSSVPYQDKIGQIWIGTYKNGLLRYSPQERRIYNYPNTRSLGDIRSIFQDSFGRFFVGTLSSGLYMLKDPYTPALCIPERIAPDTIDGRLSVNALTESVYDKQLWIGTDEGILALDNNSLAPARLSSDFPSSPVLNLRNDGEGVIWAATMNSGCFYIDTTPGCFDYSDEILPPYPEGAAGIISVYRDKEGTLWSGALNCPIIKLPREASNWETAHGSFGYSKEKMPLFFSLAEDNKGNTYFGCYGALFCRNEKNGSLSRFDKNNSRTITDNRIMRMRTDSHGNVWLGTMNGFGAITAEGQHIALSDKGDVMGFCQKNDSIYVATLNDGIYSIGIDSPLTEESKPGNSRINDESGFQPIVLSIAASRKDNIIYVGTEDEGLWKYDISKSRYALTDFVPRHCNLQIAFINEDPHGSLWISTNKGLFRVNTDNPVQRTLYTKADGFKNDYFTYNGFASDSMLILPAVTELEVVMLDSVSADYTDYGPTRFGITDMFFNNRRFDELPEDVRSSISGGKLPQYSKEICLPAELNNFNIGFTAYDYSDSKGPAFMYRLDGYDTEWKQTPDGQKSATYTNLPPGNYTFRLRAGNSNIHTADNEHSLQIKILPPWYLSWPAIVLYIILVAAAVLFAMYLVRRREREKAHLMLMEQEKRNLEKVNRTKLRFFTNVTHELLTPLTVISAAVNELRDGKGDTKNLCRIAGVNTSKLVRLLQQILEFRKVETDNIKLRVHYGDIGRFAANTAEAVRPLTLRKSQKMIVRMPENVSMGYFDPDKLDKILYNLISNASKYSGENGTVTVEGSLSPDSRSFILRVADNGQGIAKSRQADLFKRFYDGDYREHNTQGTGIGLSLTRDLVLLNHGTISVESEEGKGTCFTIVLPITADAFSDDEKTVVKPASPDIQQEFFTGTDDESSEGSETGHLIPKQRSKILIIEDNEDLLGLMKQILGQNYEVITTTDGNTGLEKAFSDSPDLIITDITMPGIDGLELIRRLRKDRRTALRPILVLTARRQDEDRTECYEAGADVYLPKPFSPTSLKACIATQLKAHKNLAGDKDGQVVIRLKKHNYKSADEQFLDLAAEVVRKHLDNEAFDIPTFAKETCMSQTHLFRKLKELTDMSPSHFIRTVRLRNAYSILQEHPDIRISELSDMVGFGDARYFSKCFKAEFGVIPSEIKPRTDNTLDNKE